MAAKPQVALKELLKEAELTSSSYLIVEGATDKAFYREWLTQTGNSRKVKELVIEAVDAIHVDQSRVDELDLPRGARSSVIAVALEASARPVDMRCIADRDCGHRVDDFTLDTLWWTDFPALESYLFDGEGLDTVNRMVLGERLPSGNELVANLGPILRELYTVRQYNENLPTPNLSKGFDKSKDPSSFDVRKTVAPDVASIAPTYVRPTDADPRSYAYGHDVADLLLFVYANEIKNQARVPHRDALEAHFRLCLLLCRGFDSSGLATQLSSWLR